MEYIERNIDQEIARDQWNKTEWADRHDGNANKRLKLFNTKSFHLDLVQITEDDFGSIILPAHHENYIYCSHELTLQTLVNQFKEKPPDNNIKDKCHKRIDHILDYLKSNYSNSAFVKGKFMFITTNLELSVNDTYQLKGYFAGGFHQFAAYALWIIRNSFRPIRLYLIK